MDNSEREKINRHLHRFMGKCLSPDPECECIPDQYCSSDSPRSLLDAVVAKVDGIELVAELQTEWIRSRPEVRRPWVDDWLKMTAEHIALACARATGFELADGDGEGVENAN